MKKIIGITTLFIIILLILFVPIPSGTYKDGGTREYRALTYRIVHWNRLTDDGKYTEIKKYFGMDCFKTIDSLWVMEAQNVEHSFTATVIEINGSNILVEPLDDEVERNSSDRISFYNPNTYIEVEVGSLVEVTYTGNIMESNPAKIAASSWELAKDLRHMEYNEIWLDKNKIDKEKGVQSMDIVITEIYSNCFFARKVIPTPHTIKINGELSDTWCVGDQVLVMHKNTYYDSNTQKIEADMISVEESTFELQDGVAYKPVIYLYPEQMTDVTVKLSLNGNLTCTYPLYNNGWKVLAHPDGTLYDTKGVSYNYLYWEGDVKANWDMTRGFCVKGEDTAAFLEAALEKLGLTRREANEFIVFWLPFMQDNPYNIISFQTAAYIDAAKLNIYPLPDTLIRVFMTYQVADTYVKINKQELTAPERIGFTVVEWGGTNVN